MTTAAPRRAPADEAPADATTIPPALASFRLVRAEDLPEDRRQAFAATFRNIPRPPKLLDHLLSPNYVNAASSAQLVDLIVAEPLIAAKVLATINSPAYGLKTLVSSLGQAVTYLGLNTIRSLCLQYILIASFHTDSAERKRRVEAAWTASALASELTQQLASRLDFEDRGSLVSSVVLSFLGGLATTATMSREELASTAARSLLERSIAEQQTLGLSASQIGRLLMNDWGLPAKIVADAAEIDSVLLTPSSAFAADRGARLALCYVCTRLGERLAEGELKDLTAFEPHAPADADLFHLQSYLGQPKLQRFAQVIGSPELGRSIRRILSTMRG